MTLRSIYAHDVASGWARSKPGAIVREADLAPLPELLQKYLRRAHVVGRRRARAMHVTWSAQMKPAPDADFMDATVEQTSFFFPNERHFLMSASRKGVPFLGLHRYVGAHATMQIRLFGLLPIVDARGPEMDQSETVTLFNDMCVLAPSTLLDADVTWEVLDEGALRGTFTNEGHTIRADLLFDADGDLVNFVSNDRYLSADGKKYERYPWSTPLRAYRDFGVARIASRGDAIWKMPAGDFRYGTFDVEALDYERSARSSASRAAIFASR